MKKRTVTSKTNKTYQMTIKNLKTGRIIEGREFDAASAEKAREFFESKNFEVSDLVELGPATETILTFDRTEDHINKYGFKPAWGDYEGTGWQEDNLEGR